ncbi:MAG: hypothetical protein ACOCTT_01200 [archaeon]
MTICVIGGYPKGYDEPFHKKTTSGRRLRKIADRNNLDLEYYDLWETEEQENRGKVQEEKIEKLRRNTKGKPTVALGKYVYKRIKKHLDVTYLPHPAARQKKHREKLEIGLIKISEANS